ncbi:MAG: transglutaminase-like domain-containing protein [Treponema sp.]|nr:transglutaminase-like domain-containing protein [Treponema sp.]
MNKPVRVHSPVILFTLRLLFYYSAITLIFVHPGIAVSFDRIGAMQWFIIIPIMAVTAFQSLIAVTFIKRLIFALIILLPMSVIAGGFSPDAFLPFISGFISFTLTFLLFHHQKIPALSGIAKITALEPFFLAWVCLRLLSLSRSSEEIAGESMILTQSIIALTLVFFLFHNVIIYLCFYPNSRVNSYKEGVAFFSGAVAAVIIFIFILPADFVNNMIIENLIPDRPPQRINSDSDRGLPQRGSGRRTLPREGNGQGELRGLSQYDWPGSGDGSGENRQYLVKIIASETEPLYMGDSFRGLLDPVEGFLTSPQEPLNDLARQRLFVTWSNNEFNFDAERARKEIFSLSTLRQKYFPWRLVSADPNIIQENTGPLQYIHQIVSDLHIGDPLRLVSARGRGLYDYERTALVPYLEINLISGDRILFDTYLANALKNWQENRRKIISEDRYLSSLFDDTGVIINPVMEEILAILTSFSNYQYNLANDEIYTIAALKNFLFDNMEGDCTEFSNTLALLGRLAGIPSRVVTGYLAAEGLQTQAHLNGLAALQRQIPILQRFPFENLFMVTNAHSHSWTQFYVPGYGWLDFEATSFAIPPVGMGDISNWDVIIPILDENRTFSQVRQFPWQVVGRTILALLAAAVILAYVLRYGRELVLYIGSRKGDRSGARALYLLLLARLAADGQPIKPASKTAHEYADLFRINQSRRREGAEVNINNAAQAPDEYNLHFKKFADIYSELLWREFKNDDDKNKKLTLLKQEYKNILITTKRKGLHRFFIRIVNLRGLAYL